LAQITTAKKSVWPGDVSINHEEAGLPERSIIRMKLFTIDNRLILKRIGRLGNRDRKKVVLNLESLLPRS
jgi:mRNA interferase MazF